KGERMSNWRKPECICSILNPEMRNYACGVKLPHQVLRQLSILSPQENIEKRERELWRREDWGRLVFLHQRPCRVKTFVRILRRSHRNSLYQAYWPLLRRIWVDTESVFAELSQWRELFSDSGAHSPETFMSSEERAFLASLPQHLTIYRGYNPRYDNKAGHSW